MTSCPWLSSPYIIAEIGLNHGGHLKNALEAIEMVKHAGCDAVKFQTFKAEEFCDPSVLYTYTSQGISVTEPMVDMFRRYELRDSDWMECVEHSNKLGIDFLTTPQNVSDLHHFDVTALPAIKVGSDDLTNLRHLAQVAATARPLILSSGMARMAEVATALDVVGWPKRRDVAVLVCTSEYPTPPGSVNARRVSTLKSAFPGLTVGFSDHTIGDTAAVAACALGAEIFEKHFTTDRSLPGPDQWFSADQQALRQWVQAIRDCSMSMGSGVMEPTRDEEVMATIARRTVVALADLAEGHVVTPSDVGIRRSGSGNGLPPELLDFVVGLKVQVPLAMYAPVRWSNFVQRKAPLELGGGE